MSGSAINFLSAVVCSALPQCPKSIPYRPYRLAGVLVASVYGGQTLSHTVQLVDGSEIKVTQPLRDGLAAVRPPVGASVTVSWSPDACILLPP